MLELSNSVYFLHLTKLFLWHLHPQAYLLQHSGVHQVAKGHHTMALEWISRKPVMWNVQVSLVQSKSPLRPDMKDIFHNLTGTDSKWCKCLIQGENYILKTGHTLENGLPLDSQCIQHYRHTSISVSIHNYLCFWAHLCELHGGLICVAFRLSVRLSVCLWQISD